jgi:hypothetical protein
MLLTFVFAFRFVFALPSTTLIYFSEKSDSATTRADLVNALMLSIATSESLRIRVFVNTPCHGSQHERHRPPLHVLSIPRPSCCPAPRNLVKRGTTLLSIASYASIGEQIFLIEYQIPPTNVESRDVLTQTG